MWMQAAGMALSVLGAGASAKAAEVQQRVQAANQYQQTLINQEREYKQIQQALANQSKQNNAIAKADIQSLINTNFTAGLLNLQRALQKQQTAGDINRIGKTRLQALASAEVSAAASGTIGASVDAVAADIEMKMGEAELDARVQNDMNTMTLDTQLRNLYTEYRNSQVQIDESVPDIPGMPSQYGAVSVSAGSAMLGAAINYAGNYLSNYVSLGLGSSSSTGLAGLGQPGGATLSTGFGSMSNFTPSASFKL